MLYYTVSQLCMECILTSMALPVGEIIYYRMTLAIFCVLVYCAQCISLFLDTFLLLHLITSIGSY